MRNQKGNVISVILGVVAGLITLCFILSITTVPTGHVGIKTRFGAVQNEYITEGLNFKVPFIEDIKKMDCRTQRVDVQGEGASKDLQTVSTHIAVNYRINQEKAFNLYKTVGVGYELTLVEPAIQEAMKASLAQYTAEELITKRAEVANILEETLKNKLDEQGIVIESTAIVDLNFSQTYNDAIERKQVAEQEAKKAEQELEKAKIEAEKKVVEAQAEADALKVQKQEITADLLELRRIENEAKWIERWDGQLPSTMLGESVPMVDIGG
ncbi:MAG: prohibitin family protein [Clostridia bacterium]|nr:prohibitin family protein [Clostridia bacterium]